MYKVFYFFSKKWYFDILYNKYIVLPLFFISYSQIYQIVDKGLLELIGPTGLKGYLMRLTKQIIYLHTGIFYQYICFFLFFCLLFFLF